MFLRAEDLNDFDKLFSKETKNPSEIQKCLTRDIWEQYKNQSFDSGVSFKTCIFTRVKNPGSKIGIYVGSYNSYYKFNKIYDKVIKNLHRHSPSAVHMSKISL